MASHVGVYDRLDGPGIEPTWPIRTVETRAGG